MKAKLYAEYSQMLARYQSKDIQLFEFLQWARQWPSEAFKNWPGEQLQLRQPYQDLWLDLIDRFESSALFTEESCSFSQNDLLLSMSRWVQKVEGFISSGSPQGSPS